MFTMYKSSVNFLFTFFLTKYFESSANPLSKFLGRDLTQNSSHTVKQPYLLNENCNHCQPNLCLSEECIHLASKVLSKLDRNTNPCDDFYRFACGGWQDENEFRLNSEDTIFYASNLDEMPAATDEILEDLLKGRRRIDDYFYKTKSYRDMKTFYDSCMNTDLIKEEGFDPALSVLKSLKEFYVEKPFDSQMWNLTKAIVELMKWNSAPFFLLTLDTDLKNSSKWIPVISLPKHYGLISDELFSPHPFKQTLPRKSKVLKLKTLKKFFKKILNEMNNEAFYLEILSKIQSRESLKLLLKFFRLQQRSNEPFLIRRRQYEKPNKYTSFFSRLVQTDSVRGSNEIGGNDLKKNNNEFAKVDFYDSYYIDNKSNFTDYFQEIFTSIKQSSTISPTSPHTEFYFEHQDSDSNTLEVMNNLVEAWNLFKESNFTFNNESYDQSNIANDTAYNNDTKHNDTLGDSEDYKILLEDAEEAMQMFFVLGINPEMHRRDLYRAIQEEMDNTRLSEIEKHLKEHFFRDLFMLSSDVVEEGSTAYIPVSPSMPSHSIYEQMFIKKQAFTRVLNFITELKKCEPTEQEKIVIMQEGRIFNSFTIGQLQEKYPAINWIYFFNELLKGPLKEDDEVLIFHTNYLEKFFSVLEMEDPWVVHHTALTLFSFNVLKELVTVSEDTPRNEFCLTATKESMDLPLSHMYLKYLGDDAIKELRQEVMPMVEELKSSAKEEMLESKILTEKDKEVAIEKIDRMKWGIGALDDLYNISYVEEMHPNVTIDKQHFLYNVMNLYSMINDIKYEMFASKIDPADHIWDFTAQPYTINAFYIQTTNSIVIPEAFLKPPYFYRGAPSYFKYGATGMAFAHEMMHGFDFTAKEFDWSGIRKFPFSSNMSEGIRENVACFNNMVEEVFTRTEKVEGINVLMSVDNNATMNENLADVIAIELAFKSFKNMEQTSGQDPLLPGLPYTREQLFFIGFAQPYCALLPAIARVVLMEIDEHLVHNIRVNSLLLNSPYFGEAFQCSDTDRMRAKNSHPTCTIF